MWKQTLVVVIVLALGSVAFAGRGGGKGGPGGGGGGGEDPVADPAIAFVDRTGGGSALVVMNDDGSNQTVLVAADAADPNWSPDGSQIVFQGGNSASTNALYVIDVDGTDLRALPKEPGGYAVQPAWSPLPAPDGRTKIAFKMFADVWLVNPDGTGLQQLTASDTVAQGHPTWDPSGTRMAVYYVEIDPVTSARIVEGIMLLELGVGTEDPVRVVSSTRLVERVPDASATGYDQLDWARTGDRILYRVHDTGRSVADGNASDIWMLDLAGPTQPTCLTAGDDATTIEPRWSPDDTQVLFTRLTGRKKDSGLHLLGLDGSGPTSLGVKSGVSSDWRR